MRKRPCGFADWRLGTRREAVLFAVGANATHGMRRTNADKRRAVMTLLKDDEWARWSTYEIARRCRVEESMVRHLRESASAVKPQMDPQVRIVRRNGKEYEMDVSRLRSGPSPESDPTTSQPIIDSPARYTHRADVYSTMPSHIRSGVGTRATRGQNGGE